MSHEPLLEPLVRWWRIKKILPDLPNGGVHVDIGCGTTPELVNFVKDQMSQSIGIDITVKAQKQGKVRLLRQKLQKKLNLPTSSVEVVTLLAVLEHLDFPQDIIKECYRILKPGGVALLTVPSPNSALLLNLLSKIGFLSQKMINQHKHYFTHYQLGQIFKLAGFRQVQVSSFQLGLNTYVKAVKVK